MDFINHNLQGIIEIKLKPFIDERGSFTRTFDKDLFKNAGITCEWLQENRSVNVNKGILRGLHFVLAPHTDGKLIRCSKGEIFDVVVDLRAGSETFGKSLSFILKENDNTLLFIPKGFAHGFCTLTDYSEILYKHDTFYVKEYDYGIVWNDEELLIDWPVKNPIISEKDRNLRKFKDFIINYGGL
jgi:dTDP-4-dehydrorhamnose 3,5-epimerase